MSTLDRLLEKRPTADGTRSACCHSVDPQPSCLLVDTPTGESWVFPWSHLAFARLSHAAGRDELCLTFSTHEVTLRGQHLTALRDLVASVQLATVRPAPAKYARAAPEQPFIDGVTVRSNSGPPGDSVRASGHPPRCPE